MGGVCVSAIIGALEGGKNPFDTFRFQSLAPSHRSNPEPALLEPAGGVGAVISAVTHTPGVHNEQPPAVQGREEGICAHIVPGCKKKVYTS